MVRRWSYLNQLNWVFVFGLGSTREGLLNVAVNSTMYLRKSYPTLTNVLRKKWSRRMHTNNTLFLLNTIIMWSSDYKFYRNYSKFLTYHHLFRSSVLSFNFNLLLSKRLSRIVTSVSTSTLTGSTVRYFVKQLTPISRLSFLLSYSNSSWSFMSINSNLAEFNWAQISNIQLPIAVRSGASLVPVSSKPTVGFAPAPLLNFAFSFYQSWVISLYSILIKLLLFRLR